MYLKFLKLLFSLVLFLFPNAANAQMPLSQGKQIINMTQNNWVAFRDYNGQQLVYFTHLESWRCHLKTVEYKLNNEKNSKQWKLQPCDPANPNAVTIDKPYLAFGLNSVQKIGVKLTFTDGTKTQSVVFKP